MMKGDKTVIQFIKQIQKGLFLIVFWVNRENDRLILAVKNATHIPLSETIIRAFAFLSTFFLLITAVK